MSAFITRGLSLSLLVVAAGCTESSFIGELRCRGEETMCEGQEVEPLTIDGTTAENVGEARALDLVWQRQINAGSMAGSVLTADGTLAVLVEIDDRDERGGLLIRYDSDGTVLSRNESLLTDDPDFFWLRLATDGDAVYLAEVNMRDTVELAVYRVDEEGKPQLVFRDLDACFVEGFAIGPDGDIFVAGPVTGASPTELNIEVTRYAPDGTVIYRQDGLAREFPAGDDGRLHLSQESWLAVDPDGLAYVITRAANGGEIGLAALDDRGNVRWHVALSLSPVAQLALGPAQQPFVVGATGSFGALRTDGYALYRLDRTRPDQASSRLTLSERRPTSSPDRLAVTVDALGRAYVLTEVEFPEGARHGIERYSADFSRRESFALPGGVTPVWLQVADGGDLYIGGGNSISRIAMPRDEP